MSNFWRLRYLSFVYAFRGIADFFRAHIHAQFHLLAMLVTLGLAIYYPIQRWEWVAIWGCIGLVVSMEAMNTALEYLTDLVSPEYNVLAGKAKDMAAGAVLIAAFTAAVTGAIIFWPYFRSEWIS